MSLRCKFGFHDYKPDRDVYEVRCSRCNEVNLFMTNVLLNLEREARGMYKKDRWSEEQLEEYLEEVWSDNA